VIVVNTCGFIGEAETGIHRRDPRDGAPQQTGACKAAGWSPAACSQRYPARAGRRDAGGGPTSSAQMRWRRLATPSARQQQPRSRWPRRRASSTTTSPRARPVDGRPTPPLREDRRRLRLARARSASFPSLRGARSAAGCPDSVGARGPRALAEAGTKEICLVAQDLTTYGTGPCRRRRSAPLPTLESLLAQLAQVEKLRGIRLHYAIPVRLHRRPPGRDGRAEPRIAKYLDVPIPAHRQQRAQVDAPRLRRARPVRPAVRAGAPERVPA